MKELFNNPGFIALMGTIFGGVGLKMVESWLGRAKQRQDAGAAIRAELRIEIDGLRKQLDDSRVEERRLESEIERWQGLYWDLKETKLNELTELKIELARLRDLVVTHEKRVDNDPSD